MSKLVINFRGGLERVYRVLPSVGESVTASCDDAMVNRSGVDSNNSPCLDFYVKSTDGDRISEHSRIRVVLRYLDVLLVEHYEDAAEN